MEITRSHNKCFDDIANYLITMISLTLTTELYVQGYASRYAPNHRVVLDAKQAGKRLIISPHTLLNEVFAGRWPTTLVVNEEPVPVSDADEKPVQILTSANHPLGVFARPLYAFGQSMFVNYFEREHPQIEAKYGKHPTWPADWNFARIVRNSVAHNNEVCFSNSKAAPVAWRGLVYSPTDNGREVLHKDLWPADLIYLMMDLDTHL
jgi:hypothetical protein